MVEVNQVSVTFKSGDPKWEVTITAPFKGDGWTTKTYKITMIEGPQNIKYVMKNKADREKVVEVIKSGLKSKDSYISPGMLDSKTLQLVAHNNTNPHLIIAFGKKS